MRSMQRWGFSLLFVLPTKGGGMEIIMRGKGQYSLIIISLVLLLATIVCGVVFRFQLSDCGISKLSNVDAIGGQNIVLNYAFDDDWTGSFVQDASSTSDAMYELEEADVIAVVTPTGKLNQSEASLGQEFTIKKILRGEELVSVGQTAWVYGYDGFSEIDGQIEFTGVLNLMYPENDYLVFLLYSPLNDYQKQTAFELSSSYYGCIKVGGEDTLTLDEDYRKYQFAELREYAFFSTSEETTEVYQSIWNGLLEQYLGS